MARLLVVTDEPKAGARSDARGKLFEALCREVLDLLGYAVEKATTNYAGMQVDVEATRKVSCVPVYGECKLRSDAIESTDLQKAFGAYSVRRLQDPRTEGLLLALPGLNPSARGLYKESIEPHQRSANFKIVEEEQLLSHIFSAGVVKCPDVIQRVCVAEAVRPGDAELMYTERGWLWLQRTLTDGATVANSAVVVTGLGEPVDAETLDYVRRCSPDHAALSLQTIGSPRPPVPVASGGDVVVETMRSGHCFEYQLPASPEFFFGRHPQLKSCREGVVAMQAGKAQVRGILLRAPSGWGKSSFVLRLQAALEADDVLVVPVDSRSAATNSFPLHALHHALSRAAGAGLLTGSGPDYAVGGPASARELMTQASAQLRARGAGLLLFFDQCENLFLMPDILKQIANLHANACSQGSAILFGFSWKTDLIGMTEDFPYQERDTISRLCIPVDLPLFGEEEIAGVLGALAGELHAKVTRALDFHLREFSQGYPWLLKKLCSHVIRQRALGVTQDQLASSMLNVVQLFDDDLAGLSAEEDQALRTIARKAPVSADDLGDDVPVGMVHSLLDRNLIVRIGTRYDCYWDIFRDYLNTGELPVEESYLLRLTPGAVLRPLRALWKTGPIDAPRASAELRLSGGSLYNLRRHLRLLRLGDVDPQGRLVCLVEAADDDEFDARVCDHLHERLARHRAVRTVTDRLADGGGIGVDQLADLLRVAYPYISADAKTWLAYAKSLADWMAVAGHCSYDRREGVVQRWEPGVHLDSRSGLVAGSRGAGGYVPDVQYVRVEKALDAIRGALPSGRLSLGSATMSKNSWGKALKAASELGWLRRQGKALQLTGEGREFADCPTRRAELFLRSARRLEAFQEFEVVLSLPGSRSASVAELGAQLAERIGRRWNEGTARSAAKILVNWAKAAGVLPNGRRTRGKRGGQAQLSLLGPAPGTDDA